MTENSTFHFDDILNGHFKLCFLLVRSSKRLITGAGPPSMFLHKGISFVLTAGIEPAYYSFRDCSLTNSVREHCVRLSICSFTGLEPVFKVTRSRRLCQTHCLSKPSHSYVRDCFQSRTVSHSLLHVLDGDNSVH